MLDIIVTLKYLDGEEKEFIEPIAEIMSFEDVDAYLMKKYYNATSIKWHEIDTFMNIY